MANVFPGNGNPVGPLVLSTVGQTDISCVAYNDAIRGAPQWQTVGTDFSDIPCVGAACPPPSRLRAILIANAQDTKRRQGRKQGVSGASGSDISTTAGAGFTSLFPSQCANCIDLSGCSFINGVNINNKGYNQTLLAKKAYMFRQNLGNVTSGPITINGRIQFTNATIAGGFPGPGLTKNQMLSNAGKGLTITGQPVRITRGFQSQLVTNPNIFSIDPSLRVRTFGARQFLPLCGNRRF